MLSRPKPLVLLILNGFGCSRDTKYDAIAMVNTPCCDRLQREYPMTLRDCSDQAAGLPNAQMVNSEVGLLPIGSGRYQLQAPSSVSDAVNDDRFFADPVLCRAVGRRRMLVTAGYGNMEPVLDDDSGQPCMAHTTTPLSLVYAGGDKPLIDGGSLSDLAPAMLAVLDVEQAVEMTGKSLVKSA